MARPCLFKLDTPNLNAGLSIIYVFTNNLKSFDLDYKYEAEHEFERLFNKKCEAVLFISAVMICM